MFSLVFVTALLGLYPLLTASDRVRRLRDPFGPSSPSHVKFTLALTQSNVNLLHAAVRLVSDPVSPSYGRYYSQAEVDALVATPVEDVACVVQFLHDNDVAILNVHSDAIVAAGPLHRVHRLFQLEFKEFTALGEDTTTQIVYPEKWTLNSYTIPDTLKPYVDFIEGLDHKEGPAFTEPRPVQRSWVADDRYAGREALEKLYAFSNETLRAETSICLVEYSGSGGFSNPDLTSSMQANAEHAAKLTHVVGDNDFEDTESQLDVTIASVIADGAELWYWRTNSWLYSFAIAFQHQEPAVPDVLSMSWGWSERDQCSITTCTNETSQQYVDRVNVEYAKLALRGITILASSGDAGAPGRTNEGCESTGANAMNPILPGSSPFVTSVGATFIQQPKRGTRASHWNTAMCKQNGCFEGTTEMSVSFDNIGWTAGGGFSVWSDATPWYQETHVQQYLKAADASLPGNPFNRNGRGYPDVAAIGHACPTFLGGMLSGVDGTSCSSPLFAGIVATLNSYQASRGRPVLGFVNPLFYYMADHCDDCFNGAIEGHNGCTEMQCCGKDFGFASATGANWDPVTGLGTPNVQAMMKWLAQNL